MSREEFIKQFKNAILSRFKKMPYWPNCPLVFRSDPLPKIFFNLFVDKITNVIKINSTGSMPLYN